MKSISRVTGKSPVWLLGLFATCAVFLLTHPFAASAKNSSWDRAVALGRPLEGQMIYGALGGAGTSAFYSFVVTEPSSVSVTLTIPTWSHDNFKPQFVLYEPESVTIGPVLLMIQPPATAATVYPANGSVVRLDPRSFIEQRVILETSLPLSKTGQYYLAVYNAGSAAGRWRLEFDRPVQLSQLWLWPGQWWQDQVWAGWTIRTLFVPLWLLVFVIIAWRLLIRKKQKQS